MVYDDLDSTFVKGKNIVFLETKEQGFVSNVSSILNSFINERVNLYSKNISKAAASIPGIDVCEAKNLSVINIAPGGTLIRLTVFTKKAIEEIAEIKSRHLELMVTLK